MTEILFYHLQRHPLERVLPALVEKSLARGWRVVVQAASEERIEALDAHLWVFSDDSFLPHGTWREAEAAEQPVLLTVHDGNPNRAAVRFLLDGAPVPADASAVRPPQRSCCCGSWTRRRGRTSILPAPALPRRHPTSTRAGARAGACGCSIGWSRSIMSSEGRADGARVV